MSARQCLQLEQDQQQQLLICHYPNKMGASSTPVTVFPESKHYTILDYGYCKVWKRNDTHRETMEQYSVSIDNEQELGKYRQMWEFRMKEEQVVSVYYFTHEESKELCGLFQKGTMLTERIPYRLTDFKNIPYEEVLTIIKLALTGYRQLYREYGLFLVRSTMLGINHKNKLKIWHHPDFSSPLPQNSNCKSILDMLASIIFTAETHADEPVQYVRFSDFVRANKDRINPSFDEMLQVLQAYKQMNNIRDHDKLPKLEYYLDKAEGWEDASFDNLFSSDIAQFDRSSKPLQSFNLPDFDKESVNSAKTRKNNHYMNIYTTKDISQLMEREKFLNKNLFDAEKSQEKQLKKIPKVENRFSFAHSPVNQLIRSDREPVIFAPRQPEVRRQSPSVKIVTHSPSQHHKIEFKIIPVITNNHKRISQMTPTRNPSTQDLKPSHSSIEKRLTFQPQQRESLYTRAPEPLQPRRSKIQIMNQHYNPFQQRRTTDHIMESPRAQY